MKGKGRTKEERKELLSTIMPYIQRSGSLRKACVYSGLSYESFNRYRKQDELLDIEITQAENFRQTLAESVILKSIKEGSTTDAKWLLERVDKEQYSTKIETQNTNTQFIFQTNVE